MFQVQGLQIDAAFNSVDAWNAQQESASNHHGVMIEVKSTGDSSASEVQGFQFLQFRNGRWYLCDAQEESAIIMG